MNPEWLRKKTNFRVTLSRLINLEAFNWLTSNEYIYPFCNTLCYRWNPIIFQSSRKQWNLYGFFLRFKIEVLLLVHWQKKQIWKIISKWQSAHFLKLSDWNESVNKILLIFPSSLLSLHFTKNIYFAVWGGERVKPLKANFYLLFNMIHWLWPPYIFSFQISYKKNIILPIQAIKYVFFLYLSMDLSFGMCDCDFVSPTKAISNDLINIKQYYQK